MKLPILVLCVTARQEQLRCTKFTERSDSSLCMCDEHCDGFVEAELRHGFANIYTTGRDGQRLYESTVLELPDNSKKLKFNQLELDGVKRQTVLGFGGALTDAALLAFDSLSGPAKRQLEEMWFGATGAKFNIVRVPIGGTDFSVRPYTLDDVDDDFDLVHFALSDIDNNLRIPLLKRHNVTILASAWSAPAWMKSNGEFNGRTKIKGEPGGAVHKSWSEHYVKFIELMKAAEVDVWAVTTQNEPSMGLYVRSDWNANGFTPGHLRKWLERDLIPALKSVNVKIINLDDQRLFMPKLTDYLYESEIIRNYTDGIGVHWYWNQVVSSDVLETFHNAHPNQLILSTEACLGDFSVGPEMAFESVWYHAERYAVDIIDTMNHWTTTWLDWNMALDFTGGPNWANNHRNACIHVNDGHFYKAPCFYVLMHFSRFFTPGTVIIENQFKRHVLLGQQPSGAYVGVVLNNTPVNMTYNIKKTSTSFPLTVPAHSIISFTTD